MDFIQSRNPYFLHKNGVTVVGHWDISFQADRGAPAKITLDKLASWSDNANEGVKYFSGTGTYTKTIEASPDWFKRGARLSIDLGEVKNLAEFRSTASLWESCGRCHTAWTLRML